MFSRMIPLILAVVLVAGCASGPTGNVADSGAAAQATGELKEFSMDSFYVIEDGQPKPQFSVKEITVNKGDTVRITVTNVRGNHDFNLDEFGVSAETPLNSTVTVEFVADKAGSFQYYCNKPSHRAAGHWGTLTVLG